MDSVSIVVIGDSQVGKTNLIHRRRADIYPYSPSSQALYTKLPIMAEVKNKLFSLDVYEICEMVSPLLSFNGKDVFIICFSINNPESYQSIQTKWYPEIRKTSPKTPVLLVGTKSDIRQYSASSTASIITYKQGKKLAKAIKAVKYVECSALTSSGVVSVFDEVIKTYIKHNTSPTPCCAIC